MSIDIEKLRTSATVLSNLPESPGYNGSILCIDDIEAESIAKAIDAGVDEIERLITENKDLRRKLQNFKDDVENAIGCTDGDDIREHLRPILRVVMKK